MTSVHERPCLRNTLCHENSISGWRPRIAPCACGNYRNQMLPWSMGSIQKVLHLRMYTYVSLQLLRHASYYASIREVSPGWELPRDASTTDRMEMDDPRSEHLSRDSAIVVSMYAGMQVGWMLGNYLFVHGWYAISSWPYG